MQTPVGKDDGSKDGVEDGVKLGKGMGTWLGDPVVGLNVVAIVGSTLGASEIITQV